MLFVCSQDDNEDYVPPAPKYENGGKTDNLDIELTDLHLSDGTEANVWQASAIVLDKVMLLVGVLILIILIVTFLVILIYS